MEGKLPGIQVGRAVAAASVFYFHSHIGLTYFDQGTLNTFDWLAAHGAIGVDLFFAISGFIVCYMAAAPGFTPLGFLWKRFWRIFPLNAAVTIAMALIVWNGIRITDDASIGHILESILVLPQQAPVNSVGWTLEYEVAFYLLAVLILPRGGPLALLVYCAASWSIGLVFLPETPIVARFVSEHHAAFGAGILAYMVAVRAPKLSPAPAILTSALLAVAALVFLRHGRPQILAIPEACFLSVLAMTLVPWAPQPLIRFGDISYGFYLLHWPILALAAWFINGAHPNLYQGEFWRWEIFLHIALLSYVSWTYFEGPINRWARSARLVVNPARRTNDVAIEPLATKTAS
jgi:peptidoglycan/LPS O-acetylase OafA/YrhL